MGSFFNSFKHLNKNDIPDTKWYFSQVKGSLNELETVENADIISAVEFNEDGELLATGDKGGRIVIFNRDRTPNSLGPEWLAEYSVYTTFQSHELEFDCLKSLDIDEKINCIRWLKSINSSKFLLATNDKTIKLWKLSEKDYQIEGAWNSSPHNFDDYEEGINNGKNSQLQKANVKRLTIPRAVKCAPIIDSYCKRVYTNAHTYHINSISVCSDGLSFISSDDLRINLWNFERSDTSFNIVDMKPANMEELSEVITVAHFNPSNSSQFAYGSSRGIIRLCDMRVRSLCDLPTRTFEQSNTNPSNKGFFSEIISSFGDIKFNSTGRLLMARDYLTLKIWDVNMERAPVETYHIHDHIKPNLCSLYESDSIFDKFQCSWNSDGKNVLTGSYGNIFKVINRSQLSTKGNNYSTYDNVGHEESGTCLEAICDHVTLSNRSKKPLRQFNTELLKSDSNQNSKTSPKRKKEDNLLNSSNDGTTDESSLNSSTLSQTSFSAGNCNNAKLNNASTSINYSKKILNLNFHPNEQIIALAATANLYIFAEKPF